MLSPKAISPDNALDYHSQEEKKKDINKEILEYYGQTTGEWYGSLKQDLKLNDLTYDSFDMALNGFNPTTGERLVPSKKNKEKNRGAVDLTLSSSKSFSILLALAQIKDNTKLSDMLFNASNQAVNKTLDHIEQEYAFVRKQKKGIRKFIKTDNLLFAKFHHDTARPVTDKVTGEIMVDPDHHDHPLAINFSKLKNGEYKAIEAGLIFKDKKKIGGYYRSELAQNLKELGFDIVITDKKYGFFEIKGLSPELLKEFSRRSQQIDEKVEELRSKYPKIRESKLRQIAALESREDKLVVTMSKSELQARTLERAEKFVDVDKLLSSFDLKTQAKSINKNTKAIKKEIEEILVAVNKATSEVKKMTEYHHNKYSILNSSSNILIGKVRASDIFKHIKIKEVESQKKLDTMHQILIHNLKATKLDTTKLFKDFVNSNKEIKLNIEEGVENAREINSSDRVRLTQKYSRITNQSTKSKYSNHRDVANTDTITRGREERGTELERHDDDSNRNIRQHIVTLEDIRIAERGAEKYKNQNKGIEKC